MRGNGVSRGGLLHPLLYPGRDPPPPATLTAPPTTCRQIRGYPYELLRPRASPFLLAREEKFFFVVCENLPTKLIETCAVFVFEYPCFVVYIGSISTRMFRCFLFFFPHTSRIYIGVLCCVEVDVSLGEYGDDLHRFFTRFEFSRIDIARVKKGRGGEEGSINLPTEASLFNIFPPLRLLA